MEYLFQSRFNKVIRLQVMDEKKVYSRFYRRAAPFKFITLFNSIEPIKISRKS